MCLIPDRSHKQSTSLFFPRTVLTPIGAILIPHKTLKSRRRSPLAKTMSLVKGHRGKSSGFLAVWEPLSLGRCLITMLLYLMGCFCLLSPFENIELCINKYSPSRRETNSIAQWSGQPGWIKGQVITAASLAALILPRLISPKSTSGLSQCHLSSSIPCSGSGRCIFPFPPRTWLVEGTVDPSLDGSWKSTCKVHTAKTRGF